MSTTPEQEQDAWKVKIADAAAQPIETKPHETKVKKHKGPMIAMMVVLLAAACGGGYFLLNRPVATKEGAGPGNKKDRVVPVAVAEATVQDIPIEIRTIGNVLPYSVVNIVPQVSGQLTKVTFTQGAFVKKGDLLFEIDPRPYDAALKQALGNVAKDKAGVEAAQANLQKDKAQVGLLKANITRDTASATFAQHDMDRYGVLVKQGAVSSQQFDQARSTSQASQATIEADKKAVDNAREVLNADRAAIETAKGILAADEAAADSARIQLGWTQIRSPIDGRTGSLNVYQGNVVQANQTTALVTIGQIQPIYVQFTLPELNLDQIRHATASKKLTVEALIGGNAANTVAGDVSFMQNTVDTTSGTVVMRATFQNVDKHLYPGQFVDVIVRMPSEGPTVVVPATALQTSQQGNSVYVVTPKKTVKFVKVELKRTYKGLAAISSGLKAGDVVVTDGQVQLTPGAKISIQKAVTDGSEDDAGAPPSHKFSKDDDDSATPSSASSDSDAQTEHHGRKHHHHDGGTEDGATPPADAGAPGAQNTAPGTAAPSARSATDSNASNGEDRPRHHRRHHDGDQENTPAENGAAKPGSEPTK